jgi:2,3-bisphosphoglycerate-independent phosphoglycerate mutase
MSITQHSTSPVPLYLLPQALTEEIKKYGDAIAEVRIRRTTGHNYVLKVKHERRGDRGD